MLLPLVSPFIDLMFLVGIGSFSGTATFTRRGKLDNFEKLLAYFVTFMVIDFVTSA